MTKIAKGIIGFKLLPFLLIYYVLILCIFSPNSSDLFFILHFSYILWLWKSSDRHGIILFIEANGIFKKSDNLLFHKLLKPDKVLMFIFKKNVALKLQHEVQDD